MTEHYELKDHVLTFSDDVGVFQVLDLYEELAQYIEVGDTELTINASAVERVDGAMLQLLVSFIHEYCDEQKSVVKWESPSEAFVHAAKTLGLESSLHLH